MLRRILSRLRPASRPAPSGTAARVAPASEPDARPARAAEASSSDVLPAAAPADAPADAGDAGDVPSRPSVVSPEGPLLALLADRVEAVLDALPAEARAGDLPLVLRSLVDGAELTIRQPPSAFQEALNVSRREDVGLGEIVRVVERDPVLSRGVLQHASSAFYARGGGPCRSVNGAAQRIGAAGMHGVVVSEMMRALLCRPGAAHAAMVTRVWEHVVRSAGIARDLAPLFGTMGEQAYTVGLMHDVGKLVLLDRIGVLRTELRRELLIPRDALHLALHRLHEPLGGLAALRWELGGTVARAIATHHRDPAPSYADGLGEVAFVAERVDLAQQQRAPLDAEALIAAGQLTARPERLAASLTGLAYLAA